MAKQAITFRALTKHGALQFLPGVPVAFDDPDAAPYFLSAGFADKTKDAPVHTYSKGEIDIDPETIFGDGPNKGQRVMEAKNG